MLPAPSPERASGTQGARAYSARVPLFEAAALQIGACVLVLALSAVLRTAPADDADAMGWALAQGIVALRLARGLQPDPWWLPMHALFAPALVWTLGWGLPPLYPFAAFCLLASLYWGTCRTRVPLFLSSRSAIQALAELLSRDQGFAFIDLGSGLGGLLQRIARARPQGRYYGIESAPLPYLIARLRAVLARSPWRISFGDYRDLDLARYDVVYAYLSPAAMADLWNQARREMRAGSLLISNSFGIPGVPPTSSLAVDAHGRLLVWRM